jgi:hypothetical protein
VLPGQAFLRLGGLFCPHRLCLGWSHPAGGLFACLRLARPGFARPGRRRLPGSRLGRFSLTRLHAGAGVLAGTAGRLRLLSGPGSGFGPTLTWPAFYRARLVFPLAVATLTLPAIVVTPGAATWIVLPAVGAPVALPGTITPACETTAPGTITLACETALPGMIILPSETAALGVIELAYMAAGLLVTSPAGGGPLMAGAAAVGGPIVLGGIVAVEWSGVVPVGRFTARGQPVPGSLSPLPVRPVGRARSHGDRLPGGCEARFVLAGRRTLSRAAEQLPPLQRSSDDQSDEGDGAHSDREVDERQLACDGSRDEQPKGHDYQGSTEPDHKRPLTEHAAIPAATSAAAPQGASAPRACAARSATPRPAQLQP